MDNTSKGDDGRCAAIDQDGGAKLRFRAVFPDAKIEPAKPLADLVTFECESVSEQLRKAAGFRFGASISERLKEDARPLEETFAASLAASKILPSADE